MQLEASLLKAGKSEATTWDPLHDLVNPVLQGTQWSNHQVRSWKGLLVSAHHTLTWKGGG